MSSETAVRVHFTLTREDFLELNRVMLRRQTRVLRVFALLVTAFIVVGPLVLAPEKTLVERYVLFSSCLVFPVLVFVLLPVLSKRSARRRWNEAPYLGEPKTYTFTESGIHAAGESFEGSRNWGHIKRVEDTGDLVLLAAAQNVFDVIPRRAFGDDEYERFRRLAESKVANCQW